jgi:hypothetical protein
MTTSAHPASLIRRHAAIEADLDFELKRPSPDLMRVKSLKQQKLRIKDRLSAHSPDLRPREPR